jgi:hypothetical protein
VTWKSYAVVSGATVLAGWLASAPVSNVPDPAASVRRQPAGPSDIPASDITREAERLQVRVRREVEYTQPRRNPFRFGAGRPDAERGGDIPDPAPPTPPPPIAVPPVAPPPPVSLSGIAEDRDGSRVERTAILSSLSGVLLVREGDAVLADYRVARIESEAVELVKTDGTTLRLSLSTPNSQLPTPNSQLPTPNSQLPTPK